MFRTRGAATGLAVVFVMAAAGCGSSGVAPDGGPAGRGGGGGASAGGSSAGADAGRDEPADVPTDFGSVTSDVAINCPTSTGGLAPAGNGLLIDDFNDPGTLEGRVRDNGGYSVREQFGATESARFDPVPGVEPRCGAAAPGAAHIRGTAADTGATFALVFSDGRAEGGPTTNHHDASAWKGIRFRVALGDATATKLLTVQVNLADSHWDYTKDVSVGGTTWQDVTILWTDLQSAPGAPAFSPAALNQVVFPFVPNANLDFYFDDLTFVP